MNNNMNDIITRGALKMFRMSKNKKPLLETDPIQRIYICKEDIPLFCALSGIYSDSISMELDLQLVYYKDTKKYYLEQ